MSIKLAAAPAKYDQGDQARMRGAMEQADRQNHKRGQDIEIGVNCRAIFTDTVTGDRYALTVASGALVVTGPL